MMPTNTLPPAWTGNDADHHVTAGPFRIEVSRARTYNPFTRRHERMGDYTWRVCPAYGPALASSATMGKPTAAEARKEALDAVRVLVGATVEMLDWLRMNPGHANEPTTPAPTTQEPA